MPDKIIVYKGEKCFYRTMGKGKPLMLVHGFVEDGRMWNGLIKQLSGKYRLVIPDLPGFGSSVVKNWDKAVGKTGLTMQWYAEYINAIVKAEKLKKFVLLGHSMGGYIALHYAEKYSSNLAAFGLVNSHCFADTGEKKENRKRGIEFISKHGTGVFVRELYESIFNDGYKKKNRKLVDKLIDRAAQYDKVAVMRANAAMMNRADKSAVLKNAKVPVLFIEGRDDHSAPLAYSLKQAPYPAVSDVHIFSNCKHMCVFERKKETIAIMEQFCKMIF